MKKRLFVLSIAAIMCFSMTMTAMADEISLNETETLREEQTAETETVGTVLKDENEIISVTDLATEDVSDDGTTDEMLLKEDKDNIYEDEPESESENVSEETAIEETDKEEKTDEKPVDGIVANGMCADNLTWTLTEDGMVTISGSGAMDDYSYIISNPWYDYTSQIYTVVIDGASSIGNEAFSGCLGLTSITIPSSVTSIGDYAFWWCTGITDITIPENVTQIGEYAFSGCSSLVNITIPSSLTVIGKYAFESCINLSDITIPESVTYIGEGAFADCSSNLVIRGVEGSYAQDYANEYGIHFVSDNDNDELVFIDGSWVYVKNGSVDDTFSGVARYDGSEFIVVFGKAALSLNGLVQDFNDEKTWYFVAEGRIVREATGPVMYDNVWFYVENGILDTEYSGYVSYDGGLFLVGAGRIMTEVSGLVQDPDSSDWYYCANGQAQTQYTGFAQYDGEWVYIISGKLTYGCSETVVTVDINGNGDYTSLTEALWSLGQTNATICIKSGTYDIVTEYDSLFGRSNWTSSDYWNTFPDAYSQTFGHGLVIDNKTVIADGNVTIVGKCPVESLDLYSNFSLIYIGKNVVLQGLKIYGEKYFYMMHDDGSADSCSTNEYYNCMFAGFNLRNNLIGGGVGTDTSTIFNNCIFTQMGQNVFDSTVCIRYHTNWVKGSKCNSKVLFINCYLKNSVAANFMNFNISDKYLTMTFTNCTFAPKAYCCINGESGGSYLVNGSQFTLNGITVVR